MTVVWQGILLGVAIAAPVGPVGLLCIRRTVLQGFLYGWLTGLGAATADAVYGSLAGLSLASLSEWLMAGQFWIRLLGGSFLLFLGIQAWVRAPREEEKLASTPTPAATFALPTAAGLAYGSALLLTLSNPLTILSFLAIFAGLGLGETAGVGAPLSLVLGIFIGSCLWWLLLCGAVAYGLSHWGAGLSSKHFRAIDRLSGGLLIGFGLVVWVGLGFPG